MDIAMLSQMMSCNDVRLEKRLEVIKREIETAEQELDLMRGWEHQLNAEFNKKAAEKRYAEFKAKLNDGTWNLVDAGSSGMPVGVVGCDRVKVLVACGMENEGEAGDFDWLTYEQDYEEIRIVAWKFAE